jgi:XTP/dITP diphosphohydrolase/tetrapyrrole methylase family protein/MazG family protein/ATP diphosphatase
MSLPVRTLHASETPAKSDDPRVLAFARLLGVVDRLRGENGCPWDKKQTVASMAKFLVEESYEALEAVERKTDADVAEECGDLLMVIALVARIAEEGRRFDLGSVAHGVSDKLVRRHPHVFGDAVAKDAETVLANWEAIKQEERKGKQEDSSALAGVPLALPALQRAARVSGKAVSAGFKWESAEGALAKVEEEQRELEYALEESGLLVDPKAPCSPAQRAAVEAEMGDVLLASAFLASYLELDPEALCRAALARFEGRFRAMEQDLPGPMQEQGLEVLMEAWERAKAARG